MGVVQKSVGTRKRTSEHRVDQNSRDSRYTPYDGSNIHSA